MLFKINYIENHDIEKVYEIPFHFFTELQKGEITTFCEELFPLWMRGSNYKRSIAVKRRFKILYDLIHKELPKEKRQELYSAFFKSNEIEDICNNLTEKLPTIDDLKLPNSIRANIKELFTWLYDGVLTKKLDKNAPKTIKIIGTDIHDHYEKYLLDNPRICPFCGMENIRLVNTEGRADYDHYLHKSDYPFSSVNLKNLIPIGDCNWIKGVSNVLLDENKQRTNAFYPFTFNKEYGKDYIFELICEENPMVKNNNEGIWRIKFLLIDESDERLKKQLGTWNRVFNICKRYGEHIKQGHGHWLKAIFIKDDIPYGEIQLRKKIVIQELLKQLEHYEPTVLKLKSQLEVIPRFLYFKFLKDDTDFAMNLIDLFVTKPRQVNEDDLEL